MFITVEVYYACDGATYFTGGLLRTQCELFVLKLMKNFHSNITQTLGNSSKPTPLSG